MVPHSLKLTTAKYPGQSGLVTIGTSVHDTTLLKTDNSKYTGQSGLVTKGTSVHGTTLLKTDNSIIYRSIWSSNYRYQRAWYHTP